MSLYHFSCLNQNARKTLIEEIRTQILPHAPFFAPTLINKILILSGDERLRFHGFRGITAGRKRLNLTLRQVR